MVLADRLVVVRDDIRTTQVRRRTLLRRLSRTEATVALVQGPAGAGKTTLLRQWADDDTRRHVVVALSARHDSPGVLAEALVGALSDVGPDEPAAAAVVTDEEPAFSSVVVPGMAELSGSREVPYVLVLDDVHLLSDRRAHALLRALADGVPAGSVLVLSGRSAAPAWTARLRAADRASLVGPDDLAFDEQEATALATGLGLRESDAGELLQATGGWAVALHLAALSRESGRAPADGDGDRAVYDYIRSEVLDPLTDDQRSLLVRTSIVEAPSAELCDALVGRTDSAVLLRDVVRRTSLLREERGAFLAHHLLLDALRDELAATTASDEISALHSRASRWARDHGDPEAAVDHALAAGDLETVGAVVQAAVPESAGSGRSDRLARLLSRLTDEQIASDPWLSLAAAWSYLQRGDVDRRDRWTLTVEAHAGRDWRERMRTDGYAAALAALLALVGRGGVADMADLCEGALEGLPAEDPFRCPAGILLAISRALLERPGVDEALADARRWARALHVPINEADNLAFSGLLALMNGDLAKGGDLIEQAARIIEEQHGERLATAAHPLSAYALLLALQGRRPEAARALATARRLTQQLQGVLPWFHVLGPVLQARTALLLGDMAAARQLVADARAAYTPDLDATTLATSLAETEQMLHEEAVAASGAATLTPAELRVLAYLPSHLTFPQIGEQLFLSASTVKTHALSIYRKLGVGSRASAVDTARSLGLVEAGLRG